VTDHRPATPVTPLADETRTDAPAGGPAATETFPSGGATVATGPAGAVVITAAGEAPDRGRGWNADEIRLTGPAPSRS
jgi:hypothetical protein